MKGSVRNSGFRPIHEAGKGKNKGKKASQKEAASMNQVSARPQDRILKAACRAVLVALRLGMDFKGACKLETR